MTPTDLVIGVREEAREHLHHPRVEALLVGRERIPFRDPRRPRRELGAGGNGSGGDLPREQLRAPRVPARVELAGVRRDPLVGDLMRRVHRARREPGEERLARRRLLLVLQHPDRLIGEVLGEVIAVGRFPRRLDRVVVDLQFRRPLVRVAAEEAVEAFETQAEWPAIERARRAPLRARRQVPLTDGVRGVAVVAQVPCERRRRLRDARAVPLVPNRELGQHPHADRVVVATGEHGGAGRGAERGDVEPVVAQPARGQGVDVRCRDVGAEAAELREPEVVEHDHEHVRARGRAPAAAVAGMRLLRLDRVVELPGSGLR